VINQTQNQDQVVVPNIGNNVEENTGKVLHVVVKEHVRINQNGILNV